MAMIFGFLVMGVGVIAGLLISKFFVGKVVEDYIGPIFTLVCIPVFVIGMHALYGNFETEPSIFLFLSTLPAAMPVGLDVVGEFVIGLF